MKRGYIPRHNWIYLATTADKYELPLFVTTDLEEMAEYLGIDVQSARWYFTPTGSDRINTRKNAHFHYYKVQEIGEDEE